MTCCVLQFDQDRDVRQVDPQDPRPRDLDRCQEDAAGQKDGSQYLHGRVSPLPFTLPFYTEDREVAGSNLGCMAEPFGLSGSDILLFAFYLGDKNYRVQTLLKL